MKNALNWALWTVQMLIMAVAMVLFYLPARLLFATGRALRDNLGRSIMQGPYYWFCVQRRKLRGEPLWQEHDLNHLGIISPEMKKAIAEAKPLMGPIGQMVPGPVPILKMTNADVVQNLREQAAEWSTKADELAKLPPDAPFRPSPLSPL